MMGFGLSPAEVFPYIVRAMVLFTMVPVHEFAHAFAADRLGDGTPRLQGRLTLNPFAHLEWSGSIFMFLIGIGWGRPVSVDMRNFRNPRGGMALTALAGPASNLLMSLVLMILYKLLAAAGGGLSGGAGILADIFGMVCFISINLAVFNLIPIPPLDGSKIIGAVLPQKLYWAMLRYQRQITFVFMLLLISHVLDLPIRFLSGHVFSFFDRLTSPIERLIRL